MLYIIIGFFSGFVAGYYLPPAIGSFEVFMPWYVVICLFLVHLIVLMYLAVEGTGVQIVRSAGAGFLLIAALFLVEQVSGVMIFPAVIIYFIFVLFEDCRGGLSRGKACLAPTGAENDQKGR
ncbi:MAG: hypothetical protein AB1546_00515 [bacterium]